MDYDAEKVDEFALALMFLSTFEEQGVARAWKGLDWAILDRLHEKGWIASPKSRARSVVMTEAGLTRSRELFAKHFQVAV